MDVFLYKYFQCQSSYHLQLRRYPEHKTMGEYLDIAPHSLVALPLVKVLTYAYALMISEGKQ